MEEAEHVNRLLTRKLAQAWENTSEGLQDFTCLHMGNRPNQATWIPVKFKPSRGVGLPAELRVAVCHTSVLLGWEEDLTVLPTCCSPAQQLRGRNFCSPTSSAIGDHLEM